MIFLLGKVNSLEEVPVAVGQCDAEFVVLKSGSQLNSGGRRRPLLYDAMQIFFTVQSGTEHSHQSIRADIRRVSR